MKRLWKAARAATADLLAIYKEIPETIAEYMNPEAQERMRAENYLGSLANDRSAVERAVQDIGRVALTTTEFQQYVEAVATFLKCGESLSGALTALGDCLTSYWLSTHEWEDVVQYKARRIIGR